MIDFTNSAYVKMKPVNPSAIIGDIQPLLINGEEIIGSYKAMRDYCVFTNKRVIAVNVQGMTGKKKDFTSLPYSKVSAFSSVRIKCFRCRNHSRNIRNRHLSRNLISYFNRCYLSRLKILAHL